MPSSSSLSVLSSSPFICLVAPSLSLCPPPRSETLPVEYLGGKPLCMNQYYQILSSCRVPGPKQDTVISFSKTKKPPMHITVVHNYQVGGLPAGCRGGGGQGQRSAAPPPRPASHMPARPQEQASPGRLRWVPLEAPA